MQTKFGYCHSCFKQTVQHDGKCSKCGGLVEVKIKKNISGSASKVVKKVVLNE